MAVPRNVEGYYADPGVRSPTQSPTPGGYDPTRKASAGNPTGDMYSGGTLTGSQSQALSDFNNLYKNLNPYGGVPTGGGGGGGGGAAPIDYSGWGAWAAQAQPGMVDYKGLNLPKYNTYAYREWDPSMFDRAAAGIGTGVADARKRGGTAFDLAVQRYLGYQDPYASGPQTTNPGVDPRLLASMQAWGGAGSSAAGQAWDEGVQADNAMRSVYDLLGNVGQQYNQDQLSALQGDRMQFDQGVDASQNELMLANDMARARAREAWAQGGWEHGRDSYNRREDQKVTKAMADWQGRNSANQTNTATTNQWNSGILDAILSMISSRGKNIPAAGNDLSRLITMPQYQAR